MIVEISLQTVFLKVTAKYMLYGIVLLDYQKKYTGRLLKSV